MAREGPVRFELIRLWRAAVPLLGAQAAILAVGLLQRPALLIALDPADFGAFGILNETIRWATVIAGLGLATGLLRLAPRRQGEAASLLTTSLVAVLLGSALVVGLVWGVPDVSRLITGERTAASFVGPYSLRVPALVAIALLLASLHAANRLRRKATIEAAVRITMLVAAAAGAFYDALDGLVKWSVAAAFLCAVAALVFGRTANGGPVRPRSDLFTPLFRIGRAQMKLFAVETARLIVILRIAEMRGADQLTVGELYSAMALTLPLIALPEAYAQAAYPRLAQRPETMQRRHQRLQREFLIVGSLGLVAYAGLLAWLLPLVRDGQYAGAVPVAVALMPGVLAHGASAVTGYVLLLRDRLPAATVVSALALVAAAAGTWWAVPAYGAVGAAAALSAALVLRCILMIVLVHRLRHEPDAA